MKKYGYNIGFKTHNKLGKHFKNKKNNNININFLDRTGVYKISCETCDKIYIGQTGRSFRRASQIPLPNFIVLLQKIVFFFELPPIIKIIKKGKHFKMVYKYYSRFDVLFCRFICKIFCLKIKSRQDQIFQPKVL